MFNFLRMSDVKVWILQFTLFVQSTTQSNLEVLYESNRPGVPSWSYTLFPSNFPLTWRAAAELCESIPGAVMAKVKNEETVQVIIRLLQRSNYSSSVWIRNRQTITEVLAREQNDVPGPSDYSRKESPLSYPPSEGKPGMTLRCSLIRPEEGISNELCNSQSGFGAICVQSVKTPRPYSNICPKQPNRPWVILQRHIVASSILLKTSLTSLVKCNADPDSFVEVKCHSLNGWLTPQCSKDNNPEANIIKVPRHVLRENYKLKNNFWDHFKRQKDPLKLDPHQILNPIDVGRSKRSNGRDSIELIEQIMKNITAASNQSRKVGYSHGNTSTSTANNVSFSINVHGVPHINDTTKYIPINASAPPPHQQVKRDEISDLNIKEDISYGLKDEISILADAIVKYLNYSNAFDPTTLDVPMLRTKSRDDHALKTDQSENLKKDLGNSSQKLNLPNSNLEGLMNPINMSVVPLVIETDINPILFGNSSQEKQVSGIQAPLTDRPLESFTTRQKTFGFKKAANPVDFASIERARKLKPETNMVKSRRLYGQSEGPSVLLHSTSSTTLPNAENRENYSGATLTNNKNDKNSTFVNSMLKDNYRSLGMRDNSTGNSNGTAYNLLLMVDPIENVQETGNVTISSSNSVPVLPNSAQIITPSLESSLANVTTETTAKVTIKTAPPTLATINVSLPTNATSHQSKNTGLVDFILGSLNR